MATDRATTATTAHQGPKGQRTGSRRHAVLAELGAMVKCLSGELARIDAQVEAATDPVESSRRPAAPELDKDGEELGFVPLSRPRVRRVDVEHVIGPKLEDARKLMKECLTAVGRDWTD